MQLRLSSQQIDLQTNRGMLISLCRTLVVVVLFVAAARAQDDPLTSKLMPLIERHAGEVAVAIKHIESGTHFEHRADEVMPTASLIKVAVMTEAYAQAEAKKLDLKKHVTLKGDDKVQGSGILTSHFSDGLSLPIRDAVRLMIAYSDNTATNLVVDQIGLKSVTERMTELGLPDTRLHAKVFHGETSIAPDRSKKYGLGSTTAAQMLKLLEQVQRGELVSKAASTAMLEHLRACQDRTMLPRYLPEGVKIAHKTGAVTSVRCDAGLIETDAGTIAICVLTNNNQDHRWNDENAANVLIGKIARETFFHFNEDWKEPPVSQTEPLKQGASGELVEALQRTLNAKLKPSPELGVDGEFGGVTQAAVLRFQKENKLTANGIVDEATWKALGPLIAEATPVAEPETVNAESLTKQPQDSLDGQPFVTAKAWALADGRTGQVLWSQASTDQLEMASTTKIMTAWLVLKLAEREPAVLDELVTFSKRADRTSGTTSGVRAGEKIAVRELLYGLMLPSGNDAAVAFAEHFGSRAALKAPTKKANSKTDPQVGFVAAMNQAASELGMSDTRFKNPHGLPDSGHCTTAKDLLKLGWEAMQNERFREIVATRQHGCQVTGPGGYRRNLKWKNTNELLDIEGYEGVKTGTTDAAGACLVSKSKRGDKSLMLVVLGASSSKARYADSRNLYRWGWQQLMGTKPGH